MKNFFDESVKVNVIIPVLNEAASIRELLDRLDTAMTSANIFYNAIVIDDHSKDDTVAIVEDFAVDRNLPIWVRVKQGKPGKTFSLIQGLGDEQSDSDIVAMIDGDLQYPPEVLPKMVQYLLSSSGILLDKTKDASLTGIVVGERYYKYDQVRWLRGYLSHLFNLTIYLLFGVKTDVQSGIKVFRRNLYEPINLSYCSPWSFDLDLIVQVAHKGFRIVNLAINFQKRQQGFSKVMPLRVGAELFVRALLLKFLLITGRPLTMPLSNKTHQEVTSNSSNIEEPTGLSSMLNNKHYK